VKLAGKPTVTGECINPANAKGCLLYDTVIN